MQVTEFEMYWLTRLDGIKFILQLIGAVCVAFSVILIFVFGTINDDNNNSSKNPKMIKRMLLLVFASSILYCSAVFVPTTKEMCAIKLVPVIINNEVVQELPNKVVNLANDWIDELRSKGD